MKNKCGYTHMIGEDDRRVAAIFRDMLFQVCLLETGWLPDYVSVISGPAAREIK